MNLPVLNPLPRTWRPLVVLIAVLLAGDNGHASPQIPAGDMMVRHDIQLLADEGVIEGPVTTWPIAWGQVLQQLSRPESRDVSPAAQMAMARLNRLARWKTRTDRFTFRAEAAAAEAPTRIRGFADTPRESVVAGLGTSWTSEWTALDLNVQAVDKSGGSSEARFDDSFIGLAVGNYTISLNTQDRWWGPGWDGSLILSNNARPIPAVSFDRNFTSAFESKWLAWLGPWDVSATMGQLESDRAIPDALFFGLRFAFKPIPSLELGLSRTAQWCGEGRSCDAGTFADLLIGRDNRGDDGLDTTTEPGNQMAGVDVRWSLPLFGINTAVYGQFIGEDEAGGFPSRYLGLLGAEASGVWDDRWSWRWFGEFAGTSCQFHESSELFDCAYNHLVYATGYRYKGRPIGHGADNDARVFSTGLFAVDPDETHWSLLLRRAELNRGGNASAPNSLTPEPKDLSSIDVRFSRPFAYGIIDAGVGYETWSDSDGDDGNDTRFYLRWRTSR